MGCQVCLGGCLAAWQARSLAPQTALRADAAHAPSSILRESSAARQSALRADAPPAPRHLPSHQSAALHTALLAAARPPPSRLLGLHTAPPRTSLQAPASSSLLGPQTAQLEAPPAAAGQPLSAACVVRPAWSRQAAAGRVMGCFMLGWQPTFPIQGQVAEHRTGVNALHKVSPCRTAICPSPASPLAGTLNHRS